MIDLHGLDTGQHLFDTDQNFFNDFYVEGCFRKVVMDSNMSLQFLLSLLRLQCLCHDSCFLLFLNSIRSCTPCYLDQW